MRIRIAIAAATVIAALAATPAQAELTYDHSFGAPGTGAGQFSAPNGIGINQTSGDVYVADQTANRVEQFDADGNFIRMWGSGVNQTSGGDLCPRPGNPGDVCKAGAADGEGGQFDDPTGIAVNSDTGSVYVQDGENYRIQEFTANGDFVLTWGAEVNRTTGGNLCTAASLDVCGAGTQVQSNAITGVFAFGPCQPRNGLFSEPGIAVDSAGYVYVVDPCAAVYGAASPTYARVQKFDSSGTYVSQIAGEQDTVNSTLNMTQSRGLRYPTGIAVSDTGDVYVRDALGSPNPATKVFPASQFTLTGETAKWSRAIAGRQEAALLSAAAITIDPSNQYPVVDFRQQGFSGYFSCPGTTEPSGYGIVEYHPLGEMVNCTVPNAPAIGAGGIGAYLTGGLAMSTSHKLYVADMGANVVRVFDAPAPAPPTISSQAVDEITATKAVFSADIAGNLEDTTYHAEYGSGPCSSNPCASTAESAAGASLSPLPVEAQATELSPETTYYYRFVATNKTGPPVAGPDRKFTTYAQPQLSDCPNNLARQQTGAAFLLDCRAYELVSAQDQGGYNVESDLTPGQTPFGGYPGAKDKALYGVHNGVVPNSGGLPTNHGLDPYVATRDEANQRWNTQYVGIPADIGSAAPFSSTLVEADGSLGSFAFAGADLCSPCFGDGSVGVPIHRPDGSLIQGMAGSIPVSLPVSAGIVKKPLSEDGRYFVFGSKQAFEPGANSNNADATLYERGLDNGTTEIVSTDDSGNAIQNGTGIAELDLSANGHRVLFGKKLGADAAGNPLYRLFMHLRNAPDSYQLTPGITTGVLYAGMNADGTKVFFTTKDQVTSDDHDSSVDLYETDVDPYGALSIHRVSTGESGSGDTNNCDPVGNSFNSDNWNVVPGGPTDCSAVAIGGGGGIASESGAVYFLSPERLDTSGATDPVQDAPNLYVASPGETPRFVATLESELTGVPPLAGIYHGLKQNFGSFTRATGVAADQSSGNVYVLDISAKVVKKFDAGGNPVNFTAGPGAGTNILTGSGAPTGTFLPNTIVGMPAQIAVDQSTGKLYVPDFGHNVVDVFNPDGSYASQLSASTPSGVAIHPVTHDIYVTRRTAGQVSVFPAGGGAATSFSVSANSPNPSGIAIDSAGTAYVVNGNQVAVYDSSGVFVKLLDPNPSTGVAVDLANDDVYVNEKTRFVQFDASGAPTGGSDGAGAAVGVGSLANSIGLALGASGDVYATNANTSVAIFPRSLLPNPLIDNPLVLDSLSDAGTHYTADFQITPSGDQAAFASLLPLSGFDSAEHREVFRYDAPGEELTCVSCNPTGQPPSTDASLASNGLSLTDDGRAFFTSGEPLVMRDTDNRQDAYEYSGGKVELISSGQSSFDSGLLSITHDGVDAFFFTRQRLVSNDGNGSLVKLYDARAGGGFFVIPPQPDCAASDECHGPGSSTPPLPGIATNAGHGGNVPTEPKPCAKGKVRRGGRCVSRHPKKRHHKRAHTKQGGAK